MFQNFNATTQPDTAALRLKALRQQMQKNGFSGFLIPRADLHQGEYVAPCDQRLTWLTSFTGSAGFCAALLNTAGIFIDGRYSLQVRNQVDLNIFTPIKLLEVKLGNWLIDNLPNGGKIAYDPWLYTKNQITQIEDKIKNSNIELVQSSNLIDQIWHDRPAPPIGLMYPHSLRFSGISHAKKRDQIVQILKENKQTATILTQPDSIAWLLNTRGSDLAQIPITFALAVLYDTGKLSLFIAPEKVNHTLKNHLRDDIQIHAITSFSNYIAKMRGVIRIDQYQAPIAIYDILKKSKAKLVFDTDPTSLPKACKNTTEISGAKAAHQRDAIAVCEFLAWVDSLGSNPNISEIDIVKKLETFRRNSQKMQNISFDTISGSGPNGAIVHYRVTKESNRQIQTGDILLVDSGAQYQDGTTDITRTLAIGTPTPEAKQAFTLVLKGMIAISQLRFPVGIAGCDIDVLARSALWSYGLDFSHGTGHGVGSFLSVHEGPQGISRHSKTPLMPGMIISNEPGYYKEGSFGIRIENLIYVKKAPRIKESDTCDMLCFETLTLAPIDRNLIDLSLLTASEIIWINSYHMRILNHIAQDCSPLAQEYLKRSCATL